MASYESTMETLDRVCENLTIMAGQLYLGSIEPCMAKVHIDSVKRLQDSAINSLRYPLTDEQKKRLDMHVNGNNKYFKKVEELINIKQAEKDAKSQAQPE